jgi:PAS domain S-box-containing protein
LDHPGVNALAFRALRASHLGARPAGRPAIEPGTDAPAAGRPLATHLAALVLAILLPAFVVGGAAAWHLATTYRVAFEDHLADRARTLATALDRELEALRTAVALMAASPSLREGDFAAFRPWAETAAAKLGGRVILNEARPPHRQVLNTAVPPGRPLPTPVPGTGAGPVIERALAEGGPAISDLFEGRASGRPVLAVAAAAPGTELVVVLGVDPSRLAGLLEAAAGNSGGLATVLDGADRVAARSAEHARHLGQPAPAWFPAAARGREEGLLVGAALDGRDALVAFRRLAAAPGWTVAVVEPWAAYRASWTRPLAVMAAGTAAALGLGLFLATALARRIRRPVAALLRRAEAVAAGGEAAGAAAAAPPPPLPRSGVAEFEVLREAVERADAAVRGSEAEFRAAFEQSAAPMSQADCATGRLLRVNAAYCRLLGRSEQELVGTHFADFTHPDDREADHESFRRLASGERSVREVEKRYVRPDGSGTWWRRRCGTPMEGRSGPWPSCRT